MKLKIIIAMLLVLFSDGAFAHGNFWWGLGVGALLFSPPVYVAPPPQYYYPPPQPEYYYAPPPQYYETPYRPYCYRVFVDGMYDYYGQYVPPHTERQCD